MLGMSETGARSRRLRERKGVDENTGTRREGEKRDLCWRARGRPPDAFEGKERFWDPDAGATTEMRRSHYQESQTQVSTQNVQTHVPSSTDGMGVLPPHGRISRAESLVPL